MTAFVSVEAGKKQSELFKASNLELLTLQGNLKWMSSSVLLLTRLQQRVLTVAFFVF